MFFYLSVVFVSLQHLSSALPEAPRHHCRGCWLLLFFFHSFHIKVPHLTPEIRPACLYFSRLTASFAREESCRPHNAVAFIPIPTAASSCFCSVIWFEDSVCLNSGSYPYRHLLFFSHLVPQKHDSICYTKIIFVSSWSNWMEADA